MNKGKIKTAPKLRFPEFCIEKKWEVKTLGDLARRITKRNQDASIKRVLTNSAVDGVVDQSEYFDREVANRNNLDNYFVIDEGDYVYNPRISVAASVGPISKNKIGKGIMSPLYTVFRFEAQNNDFYEQYFKTSFWHQYIKSISNTGARHDRISISNDCFMKMPLPYSSKEEHQKIADCLSSIDDLIAAEEKKLEALNVHKKGLMQTLFPTEGNATPTVRLKGFVSPWAQCKLGDVAEISSGGTPNRNVASYWGGDIPWATTSEVNYTLIKKTTEQITHDGMNNSSAKLLPAGTILMAMYGQGKTRGQVAMLGVEATTNQANANIITHPDVHNYFIYYQLVKGYDDIRSFANEGGQANLSLGIVKKLPIAIVNDIDEQIAIGNLFRNLDELITSQSDKIVALNTHKKGLMQGLFPSVEVVSE